MRGKDDEPMKFGGTTPEKIGLMERIFADQRDLLARHVNPDPAKVPQVFIPYTEVLGIYDAGLKVPDDVIICWPDDNFGYIRRLPTAAEQARPGGSGIYYHIQWLNGATTAYTWLNTTPPALIWEEMNKAWEYGAENLWVLNVGDIKPGEIGTEFFLDMAWDPQRWRHDNIRDFLEQWAARDLDARFAARDRRHHGRALPPRLHPPAGAPRPIPATTRRCAIPGSATTTTTTRPSSASTVTPPSPAAPRRSMTNCRAGARTRSSNSSSIPCNARP